MSYGFECQTVHNDDTFGEEIKGGKGDQGRQWHRLCPPGVLHIFYTGTIFLYSVKNYSDKHKVLNAI